MSFIHPDFVNALAARATVYVVEDTCGRIMDYGYDRKYAAKRRDAMKCNGAKYVRKWKHRKPR